jgi:hypothetical protein
MHLTMNRNEMHYEKKLTRTLKKYNFVLFIYFI